MVRPLFISVDPDRDNVGQLRHYAQDFHPRILYLTGTQDQLSKVTKAYRVYFSKVWMSVSFLMTDGDFEAFASQTCFSLALHILPGG